MQCTGDCCGREPWGGTTLVTRPTSLAKLGGHAPKFAPATATVVIGFPLGVDSRVVS